MRRIVIVDDDAILLQTLEIFLKDHYDVAAFEEVEAAIEYIKSNKVDLVFLDIRMPEISGIVAFDMIRESKAGGQLPIIFISGYSDKRTVIECIEKGASNYLLKPVKKELLIETIEATLGTGAVPVVMDEKPLLLMVTKQQDMKDLVRPLSERYCVVTVANVIPAVGIVKKNKPKVLLVDYDLPVYNGVQTVEKIRNMALDPKFGTVIVYRELDGEKKAQALGVEALCVKRPVDMEDLFARLEEAQKMMHA